MTSLMSSRASPSAGTITVTRLLATKSALVGGLSTRLAGAFDELPSLSA